MNAALRWLFRAPVHLYRWKCGWVLGRRFLLLCHAGRRTGRHHQTVLEIMEYRDHGPEVIVLSAFGQNADWLRNIRIAPEPEITIGMQRFTAVFRLLDDDEAAPVVLHYEQRHWLFKPVIHLVLSRFLGWRYRGTVGDRRRLVAQLPMIAFRPKDAA